MTLKQRAMHKMLGRIRHYCAIEQGKILNVQYTKTICRNELRSFLNGIGYDGFELADQKYRLTDWETWKIIVEDDLTNLFKYLSDFVDCDNFADWFNALSAMIYGLNTSGRFSNELVTPVAEKHIGYHRASCIVCTEGVGDSFLPFPQNGDEMKYYRENYKWDKEIKKWCMPSGAGKIVAYVYDPMQGMDDGFCKIGDAEIRIKNWVYRGSYLSFN